jgi:hypothetical protein
MIQQDVFECNLSFFSQDTVVCGKNSAIAVALLNIGFLHVLQFYMYSGEIVW